MMKCKVINYGSTIKKNPGRDTSLSLLAGGIAYDINNKLASILGNIEILQMYAKKEDRFMNRLDKAEKAVTQAKDLTQQLLELSNTDAPANYRGQSREGEDGEKKQKKNENRCRVLLMDDEDIILESTGELLKEIGCTVEYAKNGIEVIKLYKEARRYGNPFDVVVLDLVVPGGKGGEDTIRELKKIDPDVKAIITSGYSEDPILDEYKNYGFVNRLSKPYKINELETVLNEVLYPRR